ncbi:MAG: 16S rRNA (cytidine(1402)-2'-O)-methyltransferase [Candidatus Kapaibacteriales bacterium]
METGKLYIIPTPIGNLEDVTIRGKRTLEKLSYLACEDTRSTKKLLGLLDIDYSNKQLMAYHDHNEVISAKGIISILNRGDDVGLVSDAGTPLISDPGYRLLRDCREQAITIVSLPGASSLTAAVAASGLPTDRFQFLGFVPQKKGRKTFLEQLANSDVTQVFFESTHKIERLLKELYDLGLGEAEITLSKEISKLNESHLHGTVESVKILMESDPKLSKGEFVIVFSNRRKA